MYINYIMIKNYNFVEYLNSINNLNKTTDKFRVSGTISFYHLGNKNKNIYLFGDVHFSIDNICNNSNNNNILFYDFIDKLVSDNQDIESDIILKPANMTMKLVVLMLSIVY